MTTTPKVGGDIPFIIQTRETIGGEIVYYNGNTMEKITAAEAEALSNGVSGTPEPVGDTAPRRTPQAGEQVKIVAKDARGKGGSAHYYVTDELGNQYEVDKKTYNSIKKGKGFVDGGQLRPISEGAPQPIKKPVDVLKGEQSQARREVRTATAEVERAVTSQQSVDARKEALKQEYKAAQKEMKEARKALAEANEKPGSDIKGARNRYTTARSKFKNVSREYRSVCRELKLAIDKTKRAATALENAAARSAEITKTRDAAKAAERKAAAEAEAARQARHDAKVVKPTGGSVPPSQPNEPKAPKVQPQPNAPTEATPMGKEAVRDAKQGGSGVPEGATRATGNPNVHYDPVTGVTPNPQGGAARTVAGTEGAVNAVEEVGETVKRTENTASRALTAAEETGSKVKGGGKFKWLLAGAAALFGIGVTIYFANKSDDKVEETTDHVESAEAAVGSEANTVPAGENIGGEGGTTDNAAAVAATAAAQATEEEAENDSDIAEIESDQQEADSPILITVKPGNGLWHVAAQLLQKTGITNPTDAQILAKVNELVEQNDELSWYDDEHTKVMIHPDDTFDKDGNYYKH